MAGGFRPGQTVLAPAIDGAVGNAAVQLARAQGAVITTAGSRYIKFRAHQTWLLRDAKEDSPWPQIVRYVVEEAKE
jgi:NADPH:quinone reductase-like Zn-dependent oxidoreductase